MSQTCRNCNGIFSDHDLPSSYTWRELAQPMNTTKVVPLRAVAAKPRASASLSHPKTPPSRLHPATQGAWIDIVPSRPSMPEGDSATIERAAVLVAHFRGHQDGKVFGRPDQLDPDGTSPLTAGPNSRSRRSVGAKSAAPHIASAVGAIPRNRTAGLGHACSSGAAANRTQPHCPLGGASRARPSGPRAADQAG